MTQAWVFEHLSGDGVLTGSLGLAQELAWSSSSTCVSYCCHEMPDKQRQRREMDNTFGAQFGVCVLQSITVGKAWQLEALRLWEHACSHLSRSERDGCWQLTASLLSLEAKHMGWCCPHAG